MKRLLLAAFGSVCLLLSQQTSFGVIVTNKLLTAQEITNLVAAATTASDVTGVSVKTYGAVGDGITPDDVACQAAVNANTNVYFPPGIYLITNLFVTNSNVRISGVPGQSIIVRNTNAPTSSYVFYLTNTHCRLYGLEFQGNTNASVYSANNSGRGTDGTRNGILFNAEGFGEIRGNIFRNFSGTALNIIGDNNITLRKNHAAIVGNAFTNCWKAMALENVSGSEYVQVYQNYIAGCWNAIDVGSANGNFVQNTITDVNFGFYVSPGSDQRSHTQISDNICNHAVYPVYARDCGTGLSVINNHFQGSLQILTTNSTGIRFQNNYFELAVGIVDYDGFGKTNAYLWNEWDYKSGGASAGSGMLFTNGLWVGNWKTRTNSDAAFFMPFLYTNTAAGYIFTNALPLLNVNPLSSKGNGDVLSGGNNTFTGSNTFSGTMLATAVTTAQLLIETNAVCPTPVAGSGHYWNSNYTLYWVTPFATNLIKQGLTQE